VEGLRDRFPAPAVMGVLNVTPDSFSDGGRFVDLDAALLHAQALVREGADLVDVGGESTRPGSDGIPLEQELARVVPVIERMRSTLPAPISIDTTKVAVAQAAIAAGASLVNDVSGLRREPEMAALVADAGVDVCVMHMQGVPRTMQDDPRYDDVVAEVAEFLAERVATLRRAGVRPERICIDPGIGFGKTLEHNLELLRNLDQLCAIGPPVLVGVSRKRFLARLSGGEQPLVAATVAANVVALARGAWMFRVHDVAPSREALAVAAAIAAGTPDAVASNG
jgi:dihydropteroate synthase